MTPALEFYSVLIIFFPTNAPLLYLPTNEHVVSKVEIKCTNKWCSTNKLEMFQPSLPSELATGPTSVIPITRSNYGCNLTRAANLIYELHNTYIKKMLTSLPLRH